jgi:hypothetical protein
LFSFADDAFFYQDASSAAVDANSDNVINFLEQSGLWTGGLNQYLPLPLFFPLSLSLSLFPLWAVCDSNSMPLVESLVEREKGKRGKGRKEEKIFLLSSLPSLPSPPLAISG